ncbi:Electron transfer flavoprotein-ubiquinone oxidoreductase [Candidatus Filomicrobium marinum]|uniref:Electron transfer flavoprotein-ubiquinone oxidoreductase n=1 Tax=Candidatus Filomicrobium marinum TaxID=1608628 RepID=A0A0D6JLB4_9HYPH|nr:electron transfer flavoprotein-ubiquinone oxidoreductase [Candidatus Filomicrobium marinum]CFX61581.1 Electron transfer flavoprotein-ubiquinone oxidoreductase [Candidatus Filomicrobium marinum]CPR22467.1 Electron transfer flavoprotein-ubiquinone oxidoreductase [Candidatus Filomicrobium marinum]
MERNEAERAPRDSMDFDVVIVGAGPAGLAAAIRLMQLAQEAEQELSVVVLEKGSEVGAHILSGAVIDPSGLDSLIPDWRSKGAPLTTQVKKDRFLYLGAAGELALPNFLMPPLMNNHGNYIGSLGDLTRWLGEQAAELGVEVYPGFAASEILYSEDGSAVVGVATGDMGVGRDGVPKDSFTRGMELRGKYTLFAEGARGSLTKQLTADFKLDEGCQPQKYGIGLKEVWEIKPENHQPGLVQHSFGWPLDNKTGGGSFLYHYGENLVSVGFVVHLNYENPYLSPYDEFQRFKTHPAIAPIFEGGKRIAYGARAITEGGWQSLPQLVFAGGALLGCAAGMVNVPRIKGSHNAILSGKAAAEAAFAAIQDGRSHDILAAYEEEVRTGAIARDLKPVRNVKPLWSRFGTFAGIMLGGIDMWANTILKGVGFGYTLKHGKPDYATIRRAASARKIEYPKPDGVLTFDKLTNVSFSGTNHEEDQPVHLRLADPNIPISVNLPEFAEPAQRYCPAGVYEVIDDGAGDPRFQINAQNCVHCKTCDIKDPSQNINWVCPEGGGGPNYPSM